MKDFTGNNDPVDRIGHGTEMALLRVAGIALRNAMFIASVPAAQRPAAAAGIFAAGSPAIVSAKVTEVDGTIDPKHIIEAIHWMATQGVTEINLSIGFPSDSPGPGKYAALCEAIAKYADNTGNDKPAQVIMFTAAAGNLVWPDKPFYPADCKLPNLMSVGLAQQGKKSEYSRKGDVYFEAPEKMGIVFLPPEQYHLKMADAAERAGDSQAARQSYRASLTARENPAALFRLALFDLNANNFEAAYTGFAHALELENLVANKAMIEHNLGVVRLRQNLPQDAMVHLDRALALDPNLVDARISRARTFFKLGHPEQSLQELLAARALSQDKGYIDKLIASLPKHGITHSSKGGQNK